jgi:hypothetical protein
MIFIDLFYTNINLPEYKYISFPTILKGGKIMVTNITSKVQLLGNPFNKTTFAKNVWDMQVYNSRIYLGHGDFNTNAGPIPVIYFDPSTNKFATHFTVDEEEINVFKVLNNELYIPGTDSKEDWNFGSFYVVESNDGWIKYRTIPSANHVFDMAYYNGQLYAATGTTKTGWGEVLTSNDMGKTWTTVMPQTTTTMKFMESWATCLFLLNNQLYASGKMLFNDWFAKYKNFLVMNGTNSIVQPFTTKFLPDAQNAHEYYIQRPITVNNKLVYLAYVSAASHWLPYSMYVVTSLTSSHKVIFPAAQAVPSDILVRDNVTYVLTNLQNSTNSFTTIVYKSTNLLNWTELFRFDTDAFARSFEELNGDFYFGLGCSTVYTPASTGNILKAAKYDISSLIP